MSMKDEALALAAKGWPVFPCRETDDGPQNRAKAPYVKGGFQAATLDDIQIDIWWTRWPNAMIGVPTGALVGFFALDVDQHGIDGHATLASLEAEHGALPETLTQTTPSSGEHRLFRHVEGIKPRASFAPGLDVRGVGGYIIAAPSELPGVGKYVWSNAAEIADAPSWLVELVMEHGSKSKGAPIPYTPRQVGRGRSSSYGEAALIGECGVVATCLAGAQNDTLHKRSVRVGSLIGGGEIDEEYGVSALVAAGMQMSNGDYGDPWTPQVVEAIVRRGVEFGKRDPNKAPERAKRTRTQLKVVGGSEQPDPETGEIIEEWEAGLPWVRNADGKKKPGNLLNVKLMIEFHPDLRGVYEHDQFADKMLMTRGLPGDQREDYPRYKTDHDEVALTLYLHERGLTPTIMNVRSVMHEVAFRYGRNPMSEWVAGLKWDGKPRVDNWLTYYLGAKRTPYSEAAGRKFLISCIARAKNPGEKVDTMLILEGPQGLRKSTAARVLAGNAWFSDQIGDITRKEAQELIQGRWIVEVPEMNKFSRAEVDAVKDFLTRVTDIYRPPYGRNVVERGRYTVFIGTINPIQGVGYLKDPTGARRFWPVECTAIDLDALRLDREQLWAEASVLHARGEPWWVMEEETEIFTVEQDARHDDDPWETHIAAWIAEECRKSVDVSFTTSDVLWGALGLEAAKQDHRAKIRVAHVLNEFGCTQKNVRLPGFPKGRRWTLGTYKVED